MTFSKKMAIASACGFAGVMVAIYYGLPLLSFICGNVFGFCGVQSFLTRKGGYLDCSE